MWERWDAIREDGTVNEDAVSTSSANMVSFNHYAFGSVGAFYYQYILGIKPLKPGYEKTLIKPYTDPRIGSVSGSYLSRNGMIKSAWNYKNDTIEFIFETPSSALIELPNGKSYQVEDGKHYFTIKASEVI